MSHVLIRAQEPDDISDVHEILNQPLAQANTLGVPFMSLDARRRRLEASPPGHTRLVAVIDGKAIGLAGLHPVDAPRRAHVASIGMAVHDGFAGRGAGSALMAALVGQADGWLNYRRLELTVFVDNARAIALYERFGFAREGVMPAFAWRDGDYVDALAMGRLRL